MSSEPEPQSEQSSSGEPAPPADGGGELGYGPRAPPLGVYFLGYGVVFGGVIGFALLMVLLMKLLR